MNLKQKLSSEESLHEMTKDKLHWLGKDKIKLLRQLSELIKQLLIGSVNLAYKDLDEEYNILK